MKSNEKFSDEISLIGRNVFLKGDLSGEGNFRIEGKIEGHISIKGNLYLGDNGSNRGNIDSNNFTNNGIVEGNINIKEKLVLEKNSKIKGDIKTKILVVEEGAEINGMCIMPIKEQSVSQIKNVT
ncbi:MAG: polymer-forming cytoskeletal protein [Ignavibacteria bacterium]|nr:polymer-forming cytoskeletal protein [Ignavibacteria bacterium]